MKTGYAQNHVLSSTPQLRAAGCAATRINTAAMTLTATGPTQPSASKKSENHPSLGCVARLSDLLEAPVGALTKPATSPDHSHTPAMHKAPRVHSCATCRRGKAS